MAKQKFSDGNKQKKKQKNKLKKDKYHSKDVGKRGRIIVRNLPYSCTEDKLSEVFGEFGKIVDISLPRHADNDKPKGFGFIDFNSRLSADKATEALSGKDFLGRKISIERAVSKDRFLNSITKNGNSGFEKAKEVEDDEDDSGVVEDEEHYEDKKDFKIKEEKVDADVIETVKKEPNEKKRNSKKERASDISASADDDNKNENVEKTKEKKPYEIPKKKKARIIVRNLPFKTTEESLRKHFSTFGGIIDLNLLRRIDNKLVGCAFIEFNNRKSAVKAIVSASGKPFLGRTIVADWAIPVKDFRKSNEDSNVSIKKEITSEDENDSSFEESDSKKVKTEEGISSDEDDDDGGGGGDEEEDEVDDEDDEDDDDQEEEEESESDEDEDSPEVNKNKRKSDEPTDSSEQKKPRFESHDVSEGRTVFIKNVPFSATNDDLKECVKQFGPIFYALVCIDPVTEHSRGTAFVKFKNEEDAKKCLSAGTSFTLHGTVLDPHLAIDRDKLKEMKSKKSENKDSRNLYLIKEGVVLAGTPAATGVSGADMSRRLQLEQWKTQMLKNLNMFVSRNRLIIHNLPPTYDDKKLKQLFMKYSKPNAIITETKVMRDLKNVDGKGVGRSKEFGFINYKEHEDALHALRNINNNPKIFTESKRPIVAFSIENKRITNLKAKRLERSKMNNPLCPGYKPQKNNQANNKTENDNTPKKGKKNRKKENKKNKRQDNTEAETNNNEYVGFTAKPGSTALRSKYKLKVQAETHQTNLKKMKKENKKLVKPKRIRAVENNRNEKTIKLKKKKPLDNDSHFTKLVDKYKTQLMSDTVRKKWYE